MNITHFSRQSARFCLVLFFFVIFTLGPSAGVRADAFAGDTNKVNSINTHAMNAIAAGFHINGRFLLDANGVNFIMRGVNHLYTWYPGQTSSFANIQAKGVNTVRVVLSSGQPWTKNSVADVTNVITLCKNNKLICVLEVHNTTGYGEPNSTMASLAEAVAYWKEIKSALIGQEAFVLINIGNEPYGNTNTSAWVNDTKNAVIEMRNAGFQHTLIVDAPNWGQDWQFIMRDNAANILSSDPLGNTIFSIHMYEVFDTAAKINSYISTFANAGLPLVIGEFGWHGCPPGPDDVSVMAAAQSYGIGYLGWGWSGNNPACLDMVRDFDPTQETEWGKEIFRSENGICRTSVEATVYTGDRNPIPCTILRSDPNPTSALNINFLVTFSESVTGVDKSDFGLNTPGITGASVTKVSGSGDTYTVTVNTGSGNGTIRLDVVDDDSIKDAASHPLGGVGTGNGSYTGGEVYTISKPPLPTPWIGGIWVTSDRNVVAVGRPHVGSEVASYDGFTGGSLTAYVPMLFNGSFGGSYNSAFYIQNVHASNTAKVTIEYYDNAGFLDCTKVDSINPLASKGYWVPSAGCDTGSLPAGWVGGVVVTSNQPIVAVGRPHVGAEVMTYDGFTEGSLRAYIPMLFKGAFGGSYNSAFYIQNVHASNPANITIKYYDDSGALKCTKADKLAPLAAKGYWVPTATCDTGSLPAGWVGGVVVTSDQPIVGVGRPHIGSQVTTYNGFTTGGSSSYIPMLFKGAFGGSYNSAFYVQNSNESSTANITINYYDSNGNLNCTENDKLAPLASKGYWVPAVTCNTGSLPAGWVGGVVVTSDQPVVGVGRPHIGAQVTTYSGFSAGGMNSYLPMLFKEAYGAYNSAFYIQNTETGTATVTIKFYDDRGLLSCSYTGSIPGLSTLGYWAPSVTCSQ